MYIRTWAYRTVKDRLPAILVGVIDTLHKEKDKLTQQYEMVITIYISSLTILQCCMSAVTFGSY